jgi:flagellar basal-body rod protein FlgG
MNHGIYTALSGALANHRRLDIAANNLANLNTGGFKREFPVFGAETPAPTAPRVSTWVAAGWREYNAAAYNQTVYTDFGAGTFTSTGNPLDLAIDDPGVFFTVRDKRDGALYHTRDGRFRLNEAQELVTMDGDEVVARGGAGNADTLPIVLPGKDIKINERGEVVMDGNPVGSLWLTSFADPQGLQKVGANRFAATARSGPATAAVTTGIRQGGREISNVDPLTELVGLIDISREYETQQRIMTSLDEVNRMAASEIATA